MTGHELEEFLNILRRAGWNIATSSGDVLNLNPAVLARYPHIPDAYLTFLRHVAECSNPAQTAWFLCASDYNADGSDDTTFRWNEWERLSFEAADGNQEEVERIRQFWNSHLPIMSSVSSDYAYLAISMSPADYGAIVHGFAPEFEESPQRVCGSFDEFLDAFGRIVAGETISLPKEGPGVPLVGREYRDFL